MQIQNKNNKEHKIIDNPVRYKQHLRLDGTLSKKENSLFNRISTKCLRRTNLLFNAPLFNSTLSVFIFRFPSKYDNPLSLSLNH